MACNVPVGAAPALHMATVYTRCLRLMLVAVVLVFLQRAATAQSTDAGVQLITAIVCQLSVALSYPDMCVIGSGGGLVSCKCKAAAAISYSRACNMPRVCANVFSGVLQNSDKILCGG